MRILHVITSLRTGGAEKLMVDLLPRLKSVGHDVELLLFDGTKTIFYEILETYGVRINILGVGGNVYNPANIFTLKKHLSGYDIIHTHNTACQYYVALALGLRRNCRLVTTEHNTHNRRRKIPGFKWIDKIMYRQYDQIISISEKATDNLKAFIGVNFPIETINNGIDLSAFNSIGTPPCKSEDVIITMVAGFRPQKDHDTLIKSMTLLPDRYKLWLVGDGERKHSIQALITNLGLDSRVTMWGNRADVAQILTRSHIIVLSSHWEGLSLSSIEGMASGRPFIASEVDGLNDVVSGAGLTFPNGDCTSLAHKISLLAESSEHYSQIASACRQRAQEYDIETTLEKYNLIYQKLS